jgi:anoctamin-10
MLICQVFLPTIILTTIMPVLNGILTTFAERLTKFENYETDDAFDYAMTQKIFVLN